jgi:hypothetical protein
VDAGSGFPGLEQASACLGRCEGVLQESGNGHRSHSARHRCDPRSALAGAGEINVACEAAVRQARDADVEHDGARADPFTLDYSGFADGHGEDLGAGDTGAQVSREAMCDGRGGSRQEELERQWPADVIRGTDNDRVLALRVDADALEQRHHAVRRAWTQHGNALSQPADRIRMETVHVLRWADVLDDRRFADVLR